MKNIFRQYLDNLKDIVVVIQNEKVIFINKIGKYTLNLSDDVRIEKFLSYFDEESKQHIFPYVIEPAAGADRATLAFLIDAYDVDESDEKRVIFRFHPSLAPIKAAVLPLVKKEGMPEKAEKIYRDLLDNSIKAAFDVSAAIGRRYARQDEAGTPFCITVDGQSMQDDTVTIRERDSRQQYRVAATQVTELIAKKLKESRARRRTTSSPGLASRPMGWRSGKRRSRRRTA